MTRWWDETAAAVFDLVSGPLLLLVLLLAAGIGGSLWYFYPAWIPRRRSRRTPRRTKSAELITAAEAEEESSEVAEEFADRLAAEGRYAEAIRQRLRDIIRDLVTAGVIEAQPGWTAAELAALAAAQRPGLGWPFGAATELFSEIWYGDRPAGRSQDDRMRTLTGQVRAELSPAAR